MKAHRPCRQALITSQERFVYSCSFLFSVDRVTPNHPFIMSSHAKQSQNFIISCYAPAPKWVFTLSTAKKRKLNISCWRYPEDSFWTEALNQQDNTHYCSIYCEALKTTETTVIKSSFFFITSICSFLCYINEKRKNTSHHCFLVSLLHVSCLFTSHPPRTHIIFTKMHMCLSHRLTEKGNNVQLVYRQPRRPSCTSALFVLPLSGNKVAITPECKIKWNKSNNS